MLLKLGSCDGTSQFKTSILEIPDEGNGKQVILKLLFFGQLKNI